GRGELAHPPRVPYPLLAGPDVADLAVDDDGPQPALPDQFPADDDRRARELVPGEDRRGGRGRLGVEEREIGALALEAAVPARTTKPARHARGLMEGDRVHIRPQVV